MSFWKQLSTAAAIVAATAPFAWAQTDPITDMMVAKTVQEQSAADTDVPFDVTVTNLGPDPGTDVLLLDSVPMGTTFVSAVQNSGPVFSCTTPAVGSNADQVACQIAALGSGTSASFTFVFHIDADVSPGTFITNVGQVFSGTFDPNNENDTSPAVTQTPPPPAADLRLTKEVPELANPGTDVVYTIELANGGPGAATNVSLDDPLPDGLTFVSLTQTGGPALSCSTPGVGAGGTITCTAANFAALGTASLRLVAHVPADTDGQSFSSVGTVSSTFDPNDENNAAPTLFCVQIDNCAAGPCNGNRAVVCPAPPDQCHVQGTCSSVTGACAPPPPSANGIACSDGSLCTQTDTCQGGVCTGANPVICPLPDQCHDQGTCNAASGACVATAKTDGATCNDGNLCTQTDSCQAGVCNAGTPVVCPAADQCHDQGTCNPASGTCIANPPKANGTTCSDGNLCTQTDSCQFGVCSGTNPVVCAAADQCHGQGACNTITGLCAPNPVSGNGAACNDGNACTQIDSCQAGVCVGASPIFCPPVDQCHDQVLCNTINGACGPSPAKADGTVCNDANACTQIDRCQAGVCQGNGAPNCDDGNPCTTDSCSIGAGCLHTDICDAGTRDAPVADAVSDAGPGPDATTTDASADVASADVTSADLASVDVRADATLPDAPRDVTTADATDASAPDARADAAPARPSDDGCGCRTAGGEGPGAPSGWLILLGLFVVCRRRPSPGALRRRPLPQAPQAGEAQN